MAGSQGTQANPVHVGEQTWGVWGPHAVTHFLHQTGRGVPALCRRRRFIPIQLQTPPQAGDRRRQPQQASSREETQSVHLYGRRIRKRLAESAINGLPASRKRSSGQYLMKHRIDPCEAPLRDCPNPDRDHPYRAGLIGRPSHGKHLAAAAAVEPRPLNDVVAITTMRNEGPFILDWVAYHLGDRDCTHFLVYTNDCDDETEAILDALALRGLVTRDRQPGGGGGEASTQGAGGRRQTHPLVQPRRCGRGRWTWTNTSTFTCRAGAGCTDLFSGGGRP